MNRRIFLSENKMNRLLKLIKEQSEDEYYKISPQEYMELLKLSGYHGQGISKLPKFKGKPLWITGDLDVSSTPVDSLGNIKYVDGSLNISRTKVSSIDGITVKKHVWDSSSPREAKRLAAELKEKRTEANRRRMGKIWDINDTDDEGMKANALFKYLVENNDIEILSDEDKEKLEQLNTELERLENEEEYSDDVEERISEIEDEISDLGEDDGDVYDLNPMRWTHYGLMIFEVLLPGFKNNEYTVGTSDEMDEAALKYAEGYIDEVGMEGFRSYFIEQYIDEDYLRDYIREWFEDDIWQNPEIYFNRDDFELTAEQERRISELENYISELEDHISELEDKQNEAYDEEEDPDEYDRKYNEIQKMIDEVEEKKDRAQDELDGIEPDDEPSQDMVDDRLDGIVNRYMRDPMNFIKEHNLNIKDFVDEDELAQGLVDEDGWGIMNGNDGSYDSVTLGDEVYYIMKIN